jgi:cysteine desulfurase
MGQRGLIVAPPKTGKTTLLKLIAQSIEENYKNVKIVNEALATMLKDRLGDKIRIITDRDVSLPYILNISFAPLRAEVVLHSLESKNVFVSVGSACSSNKKSRSPVLTAMGIDVKTIDGAVRFSFSRFTTEDDIKIAYEAICKTVKELKSERFKRKV